MFYYFRVFFSLFFISGMFSCNYSRLAKLVFFPPGAVATSTTCKYYMFSQSVSLSPSAIFLDFPCVFFTLCFSRIKRYAVEGTSNINTKFSSWVYSSHCYIHAYQSLACETAINTDFRELFSLKRIYVKYKNAILSLIDCFFRI